jgi:hypothetical protein
MEHPLINNADSLSMDELQQRISDLSKKMLWAHQSGNAYLRQQVQMALETYQNKLRERQQEEWDRQNKNNPNFGDKIDVS